MHFNICELYLNKELLNKSKEKKNQLPALSCNLSSIRLAKMQMFNKTLFEAMGKYDLSQVAHGNTK